MKKNYQIHGMSCGGCVHNVKQALLDIPGIEDAKVQLKPPTVSLTMHNPIAMEILQAQLNKAGKYNLWLA
ncbi:MAG: heavy metal-associated domain-containing protein [Ferruginibacter sp.]